MLNNTKPDGCVDICPPVRNRYFYGKLLDVFHFELEQNYFNAKRWLLNRLVGGYGVVCGLGVQLTADKKNVVVLPGMAIDKCGREIIVCKPSPPYPLPDPPSTTTTTQPQPQPQQTPTQPQPGLVKQADTQSPTDPKRGTGSKPDNPCMPKLGDYRLLTICFHECQTDPVPALGGDCDTQGLCSPGAIRETYKLEIRNRGLCYPQTQSVIQNAISKTGPVDYRELVKYVTEACPAPNGDCCIPLANIQVPGAGGSYTDDDIDINVRPIVYTNDLLYQLILAMNRGQAGEQSAK
jgi:hypothetical protein